MASAVQPRTTARHVTAIVASTQLRTSLIGAKLATFRIDADVLFGALLLSQSLTGKSPSPGAICVQSLTQNSNE